MNEKHDTMIYPCVAFERKNNEINNNNNLFAISFRFSSYRICYAKWNKMFSFPRQLANRIIVTIMKNNFTLKI